MSGRKERAMNNGASTLRGVVRGNRIEIEEPLGLPEGQRVTIRVEPEVSPQGGEGLLRSAGGWSDDPDGLDEFLKWNRQERKRNRPGAGL